MNGIKAVFGIIINKWNRRILRFATLVSIISVFQSCIEESSKTCEWEKEYYLQSWDYQVEKTFKHERYKATYVLETTTGKIILFQPIQHIVSQAEPGDRIFKEKNSKYAYLIRKDMDSLKSRIFSVGCDSIVLVNAQLSAERSIH